MPTPSTNYDTSSLIKDENGLVRTGQYSSVNPNFLSPAGFESATLYAQNQQTKPLSSITTDNAVETLRKNVDRLNTISPTTTPGYIPPVTETKPADKTTATVPKAFFVNEAGQEAEYSQEQLNNPETQKFIKDNGYAMTKTEGPTGLSGEVSVLDGQISKLISDFNNYNVDADPTFSASANAIRGQYNELRDEVKKSEELYQKSIGTSMKRYTPGAAAGLEFTVAAESTKALGSILRKEQSTIAEARSAYQSGKYTQFNSLLNNLEKIRDDKASVLKDVNDKLGTAIEKQREKNTQATRDSAVGGIVAQGITDPNQILNLLNFDDAGNRIGDFTSKEVADTLKNLTDGKTGWQDKLSGTTRDFYILKGQGQLPANITSLPDDQQLFAYLKAEKLASSVGSGGSKNPITLAEAKSLNLPISTVGMNQEDILSDLQSEAPPAWFMEKVQNETKMSLLPDVAKEAWNTYRKDITDNAEGVKDPVKSTDFKKARQYFSATYDGLSDSQLDAIATSVETYVNGGESYADAVKKVIDDLK